MTHTLPVVLIVEDSISLSKCYSAYLSRIDCNIEFAMSGAEALEKIAQQAPAVTLLDLKLPDMEGIEILEQARSIGSDSAFIVMTAHGSTQLAVDCMRAGAHDYLEKPFNRDRLCITVKNMLDRHQLALIAEHETFGEKLDDNGRYYGFIGASETMQAVYRTIESAAISKATVFITGESGTGKEVCAHAIHQKSTRSNQEFVALNCAAIPRDLMESEIFGHLKGAFTGAHANREGAARRAHGGTLFLDEIGEMDMELQSKLLRFIQTGTFQKVGSNQLESVDVRFVCATNRDPLAQVREGHFREDLYYRLNVIPIELPPLRDRDQDIMDIAEYFLIKFSEEEQKSFERYNAEARAIFLTYLWPGNIRQLQNIVRNIVVLNSGSEVTPAMLPPPINVPLERINDAVPSALHSSDHTHGQTESTHPHADHHSADFHSPEYQSLSTKAFLQTNKEKSVALDVIQQMLHDKTNPRDKAEDDIKPLWEIERNAIEEAIRLCGDNVPKAAKRLGVSPSTIYRKRQSWTDTGGKPTTP